MLAPGQGAELPPSLQRLFGQRQATAEMMEARNQDLATAKRLLQITDTRLGKEARKFLTRGLMRDMSIDPNTPQSKELTKLFTNLDPDNLTMMRRGFSQQLENAPPGSITQTTQGILSGRVPIDQAIDMAVSMGRQGGDGRMSLGGPTQVAQADQLAPGPAGSVGIARYRESTTPPRLREIAPELSAVLGLDPAQRLRNIDVISRSHPAIPSDFEGQQKMARDLMAVDAGMADVLRGASRMMTIVRERGPEALRLTPGVSPLQNPSGFLQELWGSIRHINALGRGLVSGLGSDIEEFGGQRARDAERDVVRDLERRAEEGKGLPPSTEFVLRKGTTEFIRNMGLYDRIPLNSAAHAALQAELYKLAYARARVQDPGGRLSNQDIELQLKQIGNFSSPEMVEAALNNLVDQTYTERNQHFLSRTGGSAPLRLTPEVRDLLLGSGLAPQSLQNEIAPPPGPSGELTTPDGVRVRPVQTETFTPSGPVPARISNLLRRQS